MRYGNYPFISQTEKDREQPNGTVRQQSQGAGIIPWKTVQKPAYQQPAGYNLNSTVREQPNVQTQVQEQQDAQAPAATPSVDYQQQLDALYAQIMNRDKFTFDVNEDALYQQLRDDYIANGRLAMMDTMGQAATLTGGYGNSYAQAVGQQAYNQYLQGLTDEIPDLYNMALNQYMMEGDALYDQLAALQWKAEFDEDQRRYDQAWEQEYGSGSGGASGNTGSGTGSGGAGNGGGNPPTEEIVELSEAGQAFMDNLPYLHGGGDPEAWKRAVAGRLYRALRDGTLSETDADIIIMELGLENVDPDDVDYRAEKEEKEEPEEKEEKKYNGRGGESGRADREHMIGGR